MMKPLLGLVLLCVTCNLTLGDVDFINVYVEKGVNEYEDFIRLDDHGYRTSDTGWATITGQNARNGEVSFFRALRTSNGGSSFYESAEGINDYSFEKPIYVCDNVHIIGSGRAPGSVLRKSRCPSGQQFMFYVAEESNPFVQPLNFATCKRSVDIDGENHEIFYSRISRQTIGCYSGHQETDSGTLYVNRPLIGCPETIRPSNGYVSTFEYTVGSIRSAANFYCDLGFEIRGSQTRNCDTSTGAWIGRLPTCSRIVCPQPPTITHANVDSGREYGYRDLATYTCESGYEFRSVSSMRCTETGRWTDPGVVCTRVSCDYPGMIRNGDVEGSNYKYGDSVRFECDPGYLREGANRARCLATGRWSKEVPVCQKILCPPLTFPTNGMRTGTDHGVGNEVIYSCREGHQLVGSAIITCEEQEDGTGAWSETPPTCSVTSCPALEAPEHGNIRGEDFTYGQQIGFSCETGYTLQGSHVTTCGPDGWDAVLPTCNIVQCRPPNFGEHILLQSENQNVYVYNNVLRFSCEGGFELEGSSSIRCQDNGRWSGQVPTCEAVRCPPLPAPENGARDADDFAYGNTATFSCFPGYALEGDVESTCQENGTWDNHIPRCSACPKGYYKDTSNNEECIACPPNSMTSSVGSTSIAHCQCESGSAAAGGDGICAVIECQQLRAPEDGVISECGTAAGAECLISCNPGFYLVGSGVRRCRADGWSGSHSRCLPCPVATYKEGVSTSSSCFPCPRYTTTEPGSPAGSAEECFCKPGYHNPYGHGCEDVDECATNNGDCSQECNNMDGGRLCSCSIPGYRLDEDGTTCILTQSCPKLDSSFSEGHLSCTQTPEYNSAICTIRCNRGFYFVSGVNNYVTCGPESGYQWSHRLANKTARIPTCTEEFFVDVKLAMSFKYQSGVHCNTMPILQSQVEEQLQNAIETLNLCRKHCIVTDMNITCSELDGQLPFQSELAVTFEVLVKNPDENAVSPDCDPVCRRRNMREMLSETFNVKSELLKLVTVASERLELTDLPHTEIRTRSFEFGRPQMLCEEGRVFTKSRMCVPCDAGYHLPSRDLDSCSPCTQGTYQSEKGQTTCMSCLPGSTTLADASDHPAMCNVRVVKAGTQNEGQAKHQGRAIDDAVSAEEVDDILSEV